MAYPKLSFDEYINLLKEYKNKYGNLEIPSSYTTDSGINLGYWVNYIRRHENQCPLDRRIMLDEVGFVWIPKHTWMYLYSIAKQYYDEYGTINGVPNNFVYKGVWLGAWLCKNRSLYNKNKLSKFKTKKLDELNFSWKSKYEEVYNTYLLLLESYYKKYGHLLPSVNEKYEDLNIDKKKYPIGNYVARLRQGYKNGKLSEKKIIELENIGMKWNGRKGFWEYHYNLCIEYINAGNKLVSQTVYKGRQIGAWYNRQKILKHNKSLDDEQLSLLIELDNRIKKGDNDE